MTLAPRSAEVGGWRREGLIAGVVVVGMLVLATVAVEKIVWGRGKIVEFAGGVMTYAMTRDESEGRGNDGK